jgi:uncharacterized protein YjgD (DUF1641 family)
MQETNGTIEISDSLKDVIEQLNQPQTAVALKNLAKNAQVLDLLVESLDGFLRRGEEIPDNIGESIREFTHQVSESDSGGFGEITAQIPNILPPLMKSLPQLAENLPPLLEQAPSLMRTGAKLGEIAESEGVQTFLHSDMLTPELVTFLGDTGKLAVQTKENFQKNPENLGLWGLYKKSGDEDVQRGLGFLMALAKNFGQILNEKDSSPKLSGMDKKALKE